MKIKKLDIFFHELNVDDIYNMTVILDIDGTLVCSSEKKVNKAVIKIIRKLQEQNALYIFSNNYNWKRSREIANDLSLPYINSPHKKPNKKILKYIDATCPIVVIGDKYLTDGLFAQFIEAKHIYIKRYRCKKDSMLDKFTCFLDDLVYVIVKILHIV